MVKNLLAMRETQVPSLSRKDPLEKEMTAHSRILAWRIQWTLWLCSHSVVSNSFRPHGLQPARLPCPWDFPGKNIGVVCHFLLQGIFLTQGLNPCLLCWRASSLPLSHQGSPVNIGVHVSFPIRLLSGCMSRSRIAGSSESSSVSCSVLSDSLWPHGLWLARLDHMATLFLGF